MGILRIFVTSALLNFDLHLASIKTLYHKWKSPSARMCVRRGGPNEHSKLITVLINKAIVKNKAIILLGCSYSYRIQYASLERSGWGPNSKGLGINILISICTG